MPTPIFTIRLSPETRNDLEEMAKVYGAENTRAFAREILETMVSGDPEKIKAFNRRLILRAGEQLALQFDSLVDSDGPKKARRKAKKVARKPKKAPGKRVRVREGGKPT